MPRARETQPLRGRLGTAWAGKRRRETVMLAAGMPRHTSSIEVARPAQQVWRVLALPERWFEGYLETRHRSPDYPAGDARNDHLYRTQMREEVAARVIRSQEPTLLEEAQRGKTFSRRLIYRLEPSDADRTLLTVEDEISFLGLAKLAAPYATFDVRRRWRRSLEKLRAEVERTPAST